MTQSWIWSRAMLVWVLFIAVVACLAKPAHAEDDDEDPPTPITVHLQLEPRALDMDQLKASRTGYRPANYTLVAEKPAAITKEPTYRGTPGYGCIRVGDGPRNTTHFVIDESEPKQSRIYVDRNQNGDLTDDGAGEWEQTRDVDGVNVYLTYVPVHASWGTPLEEKEEGEYLLFLYKRHGNQGGGYAKVTGRAGRLLNGDNTYSVVLAESTNDGLFTVPATGDLTRRPVDLYIDLDGDGTFRGLFTEADGKEYRTPEIFSLSEPILLDGQWYRGHPTISGATLTLIPTEPPGSAAAKQEPVEVKRVLAAGTSAPAFEVEDVTGKPIGPASFKDKILILDFWATWCGPCQAAMPGLERVYQAVRDQGVEVLSVNVYDDRDVFQDWIAKNSGTKYSFTFAYDPAEKGDPASVAGGLYNVPGLPTMYVIDRSGTIASALVGGGQDKALLEVLAGLGVKVPEEEAADAE